MKKSKKTLVRTEHNIHKLAYYNFNDDSCLFTLRFKDDTDNIAIANNEFKKFIKRTRYKFGDFKYIAVLQFKKSGAIKYLMLTGLRLSKKGDIAKIWNNGGVWVDDLRYRGPLEYIIMLMSMGIYDERIAGKKAYFTSRNLIRS